MELVLTAGELGIDRDRNILARQRTPEPGGKRVARASRRRRNSRAPPDRGRTGPRSRHAAGRDGEELGDADAVFQQRDALVLAVRQVDPLAGRRPLPRLGVRDALAMDDGPQRQPVGARRLGRKSGGGEHGGEDGR